MVDSVAVNHAAYAARSRHSAPVHGACADLRPDAPVSESDHVFVQHADGLFHFDAHEAPLMEKTGSCAVFMGGGLSLNR